MNHLYREHLAVATAQILELETQLANARQRIEELEVSLCDSQDRADTGWARAEHLRRLLVELFHEALRRDDDAAAVKINRTLAPDGVWKPKGWTEQ